MACAAVKFIQFCATKIHSPHVSAFHLHQCFRFVIKVGPKSVNYEFRGCCRLQNISNPDEKKNPLRLRSDFPFIVLSQFLFDSAMHSMLLEAVVMACCFK